MTGGARRRAGSEVPPCQKGWEESKSQTRSSVDQDQFGGTRRSGFTGNQESSRERFPRVDDASPFA